MVKYQHYNCHSSVESGQQRRSPEISSQKYFTHKQVNDIVNVTVYLVVMFALNKKGLRVIYMCFSTEFQRAQSLGRLQLTTSRPLYCFQPENYPELAPHIYIPGGFEYLA